MNSNLKSIINLICTHLSNSVLIYVSRDIERSVGLESLLPNYWHVCIDKNYFQEEISKGKNVLLANNELINKDKSTLAIVNSNTFKQFLKDISRNVENIYVQFFHFNEPAKRKVESYGGIVLNNSAFLNRFFESKINQYKIFISNDIPQVESVLYNLGNIEYIDIVNSFGDKLVIQMDRSHTGGGTFFVESESQFVDIKKRYIGNTVKISKYIQKSKSLTINGCIYKNNAFWGPIQEQFTGINGLTNNKGTTVGNDWNFSIFLSSELKDKITKILQKVSDILVYKKYRGLFGIDLLLDLENATVYVLEINARQTANIPMETKLFLKYDLIPLSLLHLCEFLELDVEENIKQFPEWELYNFDASQLFLRAGSKCLIDKSIQSGVYQICQEDENIQEIKIEFNNENEYDISKIDYPQFILSAFDQGESRDVNEEIARIQINKSLSNDPELFSTITKFLTSFNNYLRQNL